MEQKIIQGDALVEVEKLQDGSIDLILTDPPYGDGIGYGRYGKEIANNEDESINYKVLPILFAKLKEGRVAYIFSNWKFAPKVQSFAESVGFSTRMQLVVVKNNIGMGYGFRNQYEVCLVFEKGKAKYNRNDVSNVLKMEHIHHDENSHPHEKGTKILELLIDHASKPGDLVLDCFAGSGSVLVACKNLKRNAIGVELEQKWVDVTKQRLAQNTLL